MSSLGDIVIGLKMDANPFSASAQRARGSIAAIADSARSAATQLLGLLGAGTVAGAVGWGVKLAADAEQAQVSFEVMLGSGKAAKAMLSDLKAFSDKSPFDSIVPREAAQTLLNFGVQANQILPTIRMLGDVAAGDGQKLKQLALVFGQMSATGRLMGQDLLQFINAGFNPLQQIAARTGESMAQLKKRMEAGGISAQEVTQAFRDATSAGGRFFGMTERQSSTLTGLWSTTKDTLISTLTEIGAQITQTFDLKGTLQSAIYWLGIISELTKTYGGDILTVVKIIGTMVAAVAILRSALWAYTTIQSLLIAKEIVLKALMGPAGWATIAAAVLGAGVAIGQLSNHFDNVAKNARKAATEIEAATAAGKTQPASKGSATDQLVALQKRLRELQASAKFSPAAAKEIASREVAAVPIRELLGIKQTGDAADQASPRIKLLRDTLASLSDMRGLLPAEEIASLSNEIQDALRQEQDKRTGVIDAIARQREELQKLKEEADPTLAAQELKGKGASDVALAELNTLKEQTEEMRRQKKEADELAAAQKQAADELAARAERLQDSTMTTAEKKAKELREIEELFIKGLIDEQTRDRGIANLDKASKSSQASKVLLAGSSDTASAVLRGAFGSKTLEATAGKSLEVQKKHLQVAEKQAQNAPEFPAYEVKIVQF